MNPINYIKGLLSNSSERSKKATENIILSLIVKIISIVTSLIVVPLTIGYLNQYEYGVWLTISSVLIWINYFDIGIGHGLRNRLCESFANNNTVLANTYFTTSIFYLTVIVIPLIIAFFVLSNSNVINWFSFFNVDVDNIKNLKTTINVIFLLFSLNFIVKIISVVYNAKQEPYISNLIQGIASLISLLLILILKCFNISGDRFLLVAIAFSLPNLIVNLIYYPITFKKYPFLVPDFNNVNLRIGKNLFGLSFKFFVLQMSNIVLYSTSNILISRLYDPIEVTPYNISFKYYNVMFMVYSIILTPLWSAITDAKTKNDYAWIKNYMNKMLKIFFVFVLGFLVMFLFSNFFINLWVGNEIKISSNLSIIMCLYVITLCWNLLFSTFFNGIAELKIPIVLSVISALLFIPLALFFSSYLGVEGVVLSLIISVLPMTVLLPIQYFSILKKHKLVM